MKEKREELLGYKEQKGRKRFHITSLTYHNMISEHLLQEIRAKGTINIEGCLLLRLKD